MSELLGWRCAYCFTTFFNKEKYTQHLQHHAARKRAGEWSRTQGLSEADREMLKEGGIKWEDDT